MANLDNFLNSDKLIRNPERYCNNIIKYCFLLFGLGLPAMGTCVGLLEEITVTAQKREQNLQDVPIAIQSFSAESMSARGMSNVTHIADFTPNVELDYTSPFSGSSQVLSAYIRGIGQQDFAFNLEPGVGVYIDGVYYARTVGSVVDLLDLDHIEVLKGPQGTLFGRNAIGGALNIITRQPAEEFDYQAEVTGGRFGRLDVRGSVDVPLIEDTLYSQIAFSSKNRDGYHKRIPFPGTYVTDTGRFLGNGEEETYSEQGNENVDTIRGKLLWHAGENVEVHISGDYSRADEQATPNTLLATFPDAPDPGNGLLGFLYNTCISVPAGFVAPFCDSNRAVVGSPLAGVNTDATNTNDRLVYGDQFITGDIDTSFGAAANYSKVEAWGFSGTVDWTLSENLSLKSITAYREMDSAFGLDLDGSPEAVNDASFSMDQQQFSQELQLSGLSFDGRLNWLVGLYYFHEEGDLVDYPVFGAGLVQIFGPNELDNDAYAVFGHANYQLNDNLSFTAGLRFTYEDKDFFGGQRDLNSFGFQSGAVALADHPDPTDTTLYFPPGVNNKTFNNLSPKLGVEYRLSEDIFTYFSWSKGFKSGGWTTRATVPITVAPEFEEEKATAYELGFKSQLFDNRMRLNVAAFFTDYEDLQITVQRGLSPYIENAGQSEIKGIEADFEWLATDHFTISGAIGYIDAEYTELEQGAVVTTDFVFNNTPDTSLAISGSYDIPMAAGGLWNVRLDYSYRSRQANDAENTPLLFSDDVSLLGAAVTFRSQSERWELTLGGKNLTDERYIVSGFRQPGTGLIDGHYSRPREWYLTFRLFAV